MQIQFNFLLVKNTKPANLLIVKRLYHERLVRLYFVGQNFWTLLIGHKGESHICFMSIVKYFLRGI